MSIPTTSNEGTTGKVAPITKTNAPNVVLCRDAKVGRSRLDGTEKGKRISKVFEEGKRSVYNLSIKKSEGRTKSGAPNNHINVERIAFWTRLKRDQNRVGSKGCFDDFV